MSEPTDWDLDADVAECEHHAEACEICLANMFPDDDHPKPVVLDPWAQLGER
jgi:hypothetical protein